MLNGSYLAMFNSLLPGNRGAHSDGATNAEAQGTLASWATLSTYLSQVAADAAMDLPPLQRDAGLLRMCHVLAELCHFAYASRTADVGTTTSIAVPSMGLLSERAAVSAQLVHFREASSTGHELDVPQQFGVWQVAGLGIVVAFRGTASQEDVIIDANISPVPLDAARVTRGRGAIKMHGGFYNGAKRHLAEIAAVVRACDERAGRRLPVWVTGHSLGGGYANALALHLLAQQNTAELFGAGGGTVTFGAPMVVYSERPASMYSQLQAMERAAEASGGAGAPQLQFHNLVNNADVVPRLLGTSLEALHDLLETYVPMIQRVRGMAKHYHPFGTYHFIVGSQIRTPPHQKPPSIAQPSAGSQGSLGTEAREGRFLGGVGDEAYGKEIVNQLDSSNLWRTFFVSSGRGGGVTHHSIMSYQERLYGYLEQLALQATTSAAATLPGGQRPTTSEAEDPASLFRQAPGLQSSRENILLDEVGRFAGSVGAIAASELGRSMATGLAQRASTYWASSRAGRAAAAHASGRGGSAAAVAAGSAGGAWSIASWWSGSAAQAGSPGEPPDSSEAQGRGSGRGRRSRGRGRSRGRSRHAEL